MYHLKYTYLYTGLVQKQIKPLKEFNLINMPVLLAAGNGRMYDPLLARFLNADPLIQDNTDAQNYNRYSYVLNNPTKYTDPSGYAYNGFEASNAAYQRMLEQNRYDMVMQQEMDFLSFKEMVKMNENFGGGNGGTGNPSGIEGNGYVENDPIDPPVGVKPIGWATSISEVKPVRTSGVKNENSGAIKTYSYNGKLRLSPPQLYAEIFIDQGLKQFGVTSVIGLSAVIVGAPILPTKGKPTGATWGTSISSKYLSGWQRTVKTPLPMITGYPKFVGGNGVRVMTTKVVGRFWGRTIPILGWGLLTYDLGMTVYNTQTEYDRIIEGGQ